MVFCSIGSKVKQTALSGSCLRLIHVSENQWKNLILSESSELIDLLNLSIIRVFGGVSAILSHQIKNLREYTEDVGDIKCSESQCIIVEIFFVIDTREKLNNGKTTDQSLQKGIFDKIKKRIILCPASGYAVYCMYRLYSIYSFSENYIKLKDSNYYKKI